MGDEGAGCEVVVVGGSGGIDVRGGMVEADQTEWGGWSVIDY